MYILRNLKTALGMSVLLTNAAFAAGMDGSQDWAAKYTAPVTAHRLSNSIEGAAIAPEELTYAQIIEGLFGDSNPTIRGHRVYGLDGLSLQGVSAEILKQCQGLQPFMPFKEWIMLTETDKVSLPLLPDAVTADKDAAVQLAYFFPRAMALNQDPVALIIHYNTTHGAAVLEKDKSLLGSDGLISYQQELEVLKGKFAEMIAVVNSPDASKEELEFYAGYGFAVAQNKLGVMYTNGRGVAKDDREAVKWFRLAATQGYARAQNNLGLMYETGRGVGKDDAQVVFWYRKAAEQRCAEAQYNLGLMYETGRGVAKDDAQAVFWYRKAAEQGFAWAQCNLGFMYANGKGVDKDEVEAGQWFRKAANQGCADAQNNLTLLGAV